MSDQPFREYPRAPKIRGRKQWTALLGTALAASSGAATQAVAAAARSAGEQAAVSGGDQDSRVLQFSILPGPLDVALAEYERVTGLKVVLSNPGIATVQSMGASGGMTPARALEALLAGTSVRATISGESVRLDLSGVSEFVAVEGGTLQVQSPKYRAPVLNIPQTLVIIPRQVFEQQNASSLREVLRNTPGITMSIGEGASGTVAAGDQILIRGFNARNDIYIDGARDPGEVSRDMFNTETVEIAKGPTSVTGGRGATGGSINLVTKTPGAANSANAQISLGSANHYRSTLDVNRKLADHLAFRFNTVWQDTDYPGRDVAHYNTWGIAPSLAYGVGTPTQVAVSYSRTKQDNTPDWGIPTLLPDVAIAQGVTVNDLNFSNWYGIASRDYEKTTSDIVTATVNHEFSKRMSLRNLTRYGKNYRNAIITPPRPTAPTTGQGPEDPGYNPALAQLRRTDTKYQYRDDRVATNQTDLSTEFLTGSISHSTDVGLEIGRDRQPTYAFTDLFTNGRPPVVDLFNPTPYDAYSPALAKTGASSDAHAASTAAYVFDTIKMSKRWTADLGVRWDRVDVEYATVATNGVKTDFGRTDHAVTGRTGVVFKPVEKGTVYAAYSSSFTPSFDGTHGLTVSAAGVNNQALPPEHSRNVEGGTKWDVAHNMQVTAAIFAMEKTNAKTTDLNGATVLAGDEQVKGVEFGFTGNLTTRWAAFGGLSVMDGTVKNSGVPTEVGQALAYVPHISANLWTTYRLANNLTIGGGTNYSDGHYFNQTGGFLFVSNRLDTRYVDNAAAIQALTKYWVFNAVAMYPINRHINLQLNATNLANEKYADRAYDRHFLPGPARQIVFTPVITF